MPKATRTVDTVKLKLETAPPDGYVVLRRMDYGETLRSQELASNLQAPMQNGEGGDRQFKVSFGFLAAQVWDFKCSIMDHNLTDENGTKLDLTLEASVRSLDPAIGGEIATYITKFNAKEDISPFTSTPEKPSSTTSVSPSG